MTRSHFRKIFRDIRSRKGRTALAALSIMVGVLGVVTLATVSDLITRQLEEDIQAERWPTQFIYTILPGGADFDNAAILEGIEALPEVNHVSGSLTQPVSWRLPDDEVFSEGIISARPDDPIETTLTPLRLQEGTFPVSGQNQIAVEQGFADRNEVGVGDEIIVRVLGDEQMVDEAWTISAIVVETYPNFTPIAQGPRYRNVYATFEDTQRITGTTGLDTFLIQHVDFETAEANTELVKDYINRETPYISVFSFTDDPENNIMLEQTAIYTGLMNALAIMGVVVSGFLVVNIINAIVVEQKKQIGVMKSFGATASGTMMMYAGIALGYGVIGLIPGVILGVLAGGAMAGAIAPLVPVYLDGASVSTNAIMIGVVMGLLVPLLAALIPVFNGLRVSILDAMTDLGISSDYGNGPLARLIKRLPLPTNVRQALSNVSRKKGRLALTGLTLTMAAAAFMGVIGMVIFLQDRIDEFFNLDATGYNISIQPAEVENIVTIANMVEGVDGVDAAYFEFATSIQPEGYAGQLGSSELFIRGVNPSDNLFTIDYVEGEGWANDPQRDGIVLTETTANDLELSAGDRLAYRLGGQEYETEVIGITDNGGDMMLWSTLAVQSGFVTPEGEPVPNNVVVVLENFDAGSQEAGAVIDVIRDALQTAGINANYTNIVEQIEQISQLIVALGGIFSTTAVIMAAIGAIGLLAALSMAVFERQKEVGVMRSIGAKSSTIVSQFLVEGVTVSIIAWAIAIPLALVFAQMLVNIITSGGIGTFTFPPSSMVIGLVGIIFIAVIASIGPSLGAARKTVSEIIRYQ